MISDERLAIAKRVIEAGSTRKVSNELGLTYETVRAAYREARKLGLIKDANLDCGVAKLATRGVEVKREPDVVIEELPDPSEPIEDVVERMIQASEREAEYADAKRLIDAHLNVTGPFGVMMIPDPHLNNPGTNIRMAFEHAKLIAETDGLFCVGIGDWLDNFIIGRLERERRGDNISHHDANRLQEHYITTIGHKLVASIGGNHNDWPQMLGGIDPVEQIMKKIGKSGIYDQDEVRVRLNTKDGSKPVYLVRHIFPGHSRFNTAHGVLAWMLERWQGEDVFVGGHIHSAATAEISREWMGEDRTALGIQLPSYKERDGYAAKRGFRKNVPFIAPVVIHDTDGSKQFFGDPVKAVEYLKYLRRGK